MAELGLAAAALGQPPQGCDAVLAGTGQDMVRDLRMRRQGKAGLEEPAVPSRLCIRSGQHKVVVQALMDHNRILMWQASVQSEEQH